MVPGWLFLRQTFKVKELVSTTVGCICRETSTITACDLVLFTTAVMTELDPQRSPRISTQTYILLTRGSNKLQIFWDVASVLYLQESIIHRNVSSANDVNNRRQLSVRLSKFGAICYYSKWRSHCLYGSTSIPTVTSLDPVTLAIPITQDRCVKLWGGI